MLRPDIEDYNYLSQNIWGAKAFIRDLIAYIKYLEAQDRRRDWPEALHEQYLVSLDERDKLQERIDYLEEELSRLDYWDENTTIPEYEGRFLND